MKKNFLKNKKGSHVGMILSFVIFITFLVFLYSAIEPTIQIQKEKESLLNFVEVEIINSVTKDLTISVIKVESSVAEDCISIPTVSNIQDKKLIIKDAESNILSSNWDGSSDIVIDRNSEEFLKLFYLDEDVEENTVSDFCGTVNPLTEGTDYVVELTRTTEYIYESEIRELIKEYKDDNVLNLKEKLNIPDGNEFRVIFEDYNGVIESTSEDDILVEVYSKEINIGYLDENAVERSGVLTISIW